MINTHRRWSLPLIFGSAVLLLVGTGLFLIVRHDARAATPSVGPLSTPPQTASPSPSESIPQWSDWDDLGGSFNARTGVGGWSLDRVGLFLRGAWQNMLHRAYNGTKLYPN